MPSSPHAKIQESFFRFPPTPPNSLDKDVDDKTIELALHVLATQRDALTNLHDIYLMDQTAQRSFDQAVNVIRKSRSQGGRAIVSGMGKSGKIGEKFVATLNSFAIQSTSLHPTEAMHGDLGMIGQNDVLIIISYSGRTSELFSMLQHIPTDLPLIAITSYQDSSSCPLFAQRPPSKCILLPAPIPCSEAEVFGVPAPTTSTTTSLALTDALTLAVARRLHPDPCVVFRVHHPGGAIGASMAKAGRRLVGDIAFEVHGIPVVAPRNVQEGCTVLDAILTAAKSVSGWVRPTPETVISPRQVQRIGHEVDVSQPLRLLGDGVLVEQGDWISIEATSTVQEAREWIRRILRQTERAKTFLKRGTVLGIVDGQRCKTGVVEIEEIIDEEELKE